MSRFAAVLGVASVIALLFAGAATFLFQGLSGLPTYLFAVAATLCLGFALTAGEQIKKTATKKKVRSSATSVLLIAMSMLVAGLFYQAATKHEQQWDFTAEAQFTLSDHSKAVLQSISQPVKVIAFIEASTPMKRGLERTLDSFAIESSAFTFSFVDPMQSPLVAAKYSVSGDSPVVVISMGGQDRRLERSFDEMAIAEALISFGDEDRALVCWSEGHGEASHRDEAVAVDYGAVVTKLKGQGLQFKPVRLVGETLEGCRALVIASPSRSMTTPFAESEVLRVIEFVEAGGGLALALEPGDQKLLGQLLPHLGVELSEDVVLEADPRNMAADSGPELLLFGAENMAEHELLDGFRALVAMRVSGALEIGSELGERREVPLLRTSQEAYLVTMEGEDLGQKGPFLTAMALTSVVDGPGPVVIFADSSMASNQMLGLGHNRDLFMNAVSWIADKKLAIGARPDIANGQRLDMALFDELLLWLVVLFLIPGLALLCAVVVTVRQR